MVTAWATKAADKPLEPFGYEGPPRKPERKLSRSMREWATP